MVRTERHKLIYYPKLNKILLFDLENDPHELKDLSEEQGYEEMKSHLLELLARLQKEYKDPLL
jgi:hypothetical protein